MYFHASSGGWTDLLCVWIRTGSFHCKNGYTYHKGYANYVRSRSYVRTCNKVTHHSGMGVVSPSGGDRAHRHRSKGLLMPEIVSILRASPRTGVSLHTCSLGGYLANFASRLDTPRSPPSPTSPLYSFLTPNLSVRGALQTPMRRLTSRYAIANRRHFIQVRAKLELARILIQYGNRVKERTVALCIIIIYHSFYLQRLCTAPASAGLFIVQGWRWNAMFCAVNKLA